jgi:hypothetical protein
MYLGLEGVADVGCRAAESDKNAAGRDPIDMQALGLEPARDGGNVLSGEAEAFAHFLWGEPVMVIGRGWVLLAGEKLLQGLFLLGRAGEYQGQLIQRKVRRNHADAVGGAGPKRMVTGQRLRI